MYWEFLFLDFRTVEASATKMIFQEWIESLQNKTEKFLKIQKVLDQNKGNMGARTNSLYRMLGCSYCSPKMVGCIM